MNAQWIRNCSSASQWRHTHSAGYWAAGGGCCTCSSERPVDAIATILKVWHHIKNVALSINAYFTCRIIVPNSIPIWFETTEPWAFLEEHQPNKKKNNKMSSDMGSVPDPKSHSQLFWIILILTTERLEGRGQNIKVLCRQSSIINSDSICSLQTHYTADCCSARHQIHASFSHYADGH